MVPVILLLVFSWVRILVPHLWEAPLFTTLYLGWIMLLRYRKWPYYRTAVRVTVLTWVAVPVLLLIAGDAKSSFAYIFWILFVVCVFSSVPLSPKMVWRVGAATVSMSILVALFVIPAWENFMAKPEQKPVNRLDLSLINLEGTPIRLDTSKVWVFDTWNLTCGVCLRQMPELEALYEQFRKDDQVEVFTVNLPNNIKGRDEGLERRQAFTEKKNYVFPTYFVDQKGWEILSISTVPHLYVISGKGELVYKGRLNTEWYHWYDRVDRLIEKAKEET